MTKPLDIKKGCQKKKKSILRGCRAKYKQKTVARDKHLKKSFLPDNSNTYNKNDNPKNNILTSENIRQKRLTILEYFDICHHYPPKIMVKNIWTDNHIQESFASTDKILISGVGISTRQ